MRVTVKTALVAAGIEIPMRGVSREDDAGCDVNRGLNAKSGYADDVGRGVKFVAIRDVVVKFVGKLDAVLRFEGVNDTWQ